MLECPVLNRDTLNFIGDCIRRTNSKRTGVKLILAVYFTRVGCSKSLLSAGQIGPLLCKYSLIVGVLRLKNT